MLMCFQLYGISQRIYNNACCFLLTTKGEVGHSMSKRGLHFFRLRKSPHCVDMDPETLHQILVFASFSNKFRKLILKSFLIPTSLYLPARWFILISSMNLHLSKTIYANLRLEIACLAAVKTAFRNRLFSSSIVCILNSFAFRNIFSSLLVVWHLSHRLQNVKFVRWEVMKQ